MQFLFQKQVRPKTTNPNPRSRKKSAPTGLNGNYWNVSRAAKISIIELFISGRANRSSC